MTYRSTLGSQALLSYRVDPTIEEASNFITTVTSLYDDNEGYAPTLRGLEKVMAEINPFSAGSDVTIFEFLDKFNI